MFCAQQQDYRDPRFHMREGGKNGIRFNAGPKGSKGIQIAISVQNDEYGFEEPEDFWPNTEGSFDLNVAPIKTNMNSSPSSKYDINQSPRKQVHISNKHINNSSNMNNSFWNYKNSNYNPDDFNYPSPIGQLPEANPVDSNLNRVFNGRRNYFQQDFNRNQIINSSNFNPDSHENYIPKPKRIPLDLSDDSNNDEFNVKKSKSSYTQNTKNSKTKSYKFRDRQIMNNAFTSSSSDDDFQKFGKYFKSSKSPKENVIIDNRYNKRNFINTNDENNYNYVTKPVSISDSNNGNDTRNMTSISNNQSNNRSYRYRKQFSQPRQNNFNGPIRNDASSSNSSSDDENYHMRRNNTKNYESVYKRMPNKTIRDDPYYEPHRVTRIYIDDEQYINEVEQNNRINDHFTHENNNQQYNNRKPFQTFKKK